MENGQGLDVIKQNEKMLRIGEGFSSTKGMILLNTKSYKNSGLENENIRNSLLSCLERHKRFEILGLKKHRANGILLQIQALKREVPMKSTNRTKQQDLQELLRICKMNKAELKNDLNNWC